MEGIAPPFYFIAHRKTGPQRDPVQFVEKVSSQTAEKGADARKRQFG